MLQQGDTLRHIVKYLTLIATVAIAGALLAACGGSDSTTGGGGGSTTEVTEATTGNGGEAWLEEAEQNVDAAYKGIGLNKPAGGDVKAKPAQDIWLISCGRQIKGCKDFETGANEAMKELGWKVTVVDSGGDPTKIAEGINQAVAAKADGILLPSADCPNIKQAVSGAKSAGVKVVAAAAFPCDPPLYDANMVLAEFETLEEAFSAWGATLADASIVDTGGEVKAIEIYETDFESTKADHVGFTEALDKCPSCEVVETISQTAADIPQLQQRLQAALVSNPDANAIFVPFSGLWPAGVQSVFASASRTHPDLAVYGGECSATEVEEMQAGNNVTCYAILQEPAGWWAVDAMVRVMDGLPAEEPGVGLQLIDQENNMPPAGQPYEYPVDYKEAYLRQWGVQ